MEKKRSVGIIIGIRIIAILLFLGGIYILRIFFPPTTAGVSGFNTELFYSLIGFGYIILGLGLFFLLGIARIIAIIFSLGYIILFGMGVYEVSTKDRTGQGLVGLLIIAPLALISLVTIIYLAMAKVKEQFK